MLKKWQVKNPAINDALFSKWAIRVQADGTIPKNRFVEKDASSGNIEVAGLDSVRVIGANQDAARASDDFFYAENGAVEITAGSPIVGGQRVKVGTSGKGIAFIDSSLINTEIASFDGAGFTNQPANDGVTAVSTSATDTTQTLTVYGVDNSGVFKTEELALNGDTDVDSSTVTDWSSIVAVELDAVCAGDVELSETSGGLEIITLSAGDTSAGFETITDGYAYNKKATVVADGASTGEMVVYHEATDGATATTMVATLNGTSEVALGTASYKITQVLTGGVASGVNVDLDVTGTEDDLKLCVGRALESGSVGDDVTVLMS